MAQISTIVMDSILDVETVINKKFLTEVTTPLGIQVFLDNQAGEPDEITTTSEYIIFVLNYLPAVKDSIGVYNRAGIATAQVFTPLGEGFARAGEIFKTTRLAFQDTGWSGQVMTVTGVDIEKVGKNGGMYQTNIDISFQYFEGINP